MKLSLLSESKHRQNVTIYYLNRGFEEPPTDEVVDQGIKILKQAYPQANIVLAAGRPKYDAVDQEGFLTDVDDWGHGGWDEPPSFYEMPRTEDYTMYKIRVDTDVKLPWGRRLGEPGDEIVVHVEPDSD